MVELEKIRAHSPERGINSYKPRNSLNKKIDKQVNIGITKLGIDVARYAKSRIEAFYKER
ncbi:MAG: hypothetical protein QXQ40_00130 [Candidatus Aenigmatarchaeota archaeon]